MPNDTEEVYDAIEAYVTSAWTHTPIAWPNKQFTQQNPPASWVAFQITGSLYGQQSIGASVQADNRWDEEGTIWFHVFVPTNSGESGARGRAKALAVLFRGKTLLENRLEFLDAAIGSGEPGDEDGNYYRVSVSIDWRLWEA
jgi:hypothetical protein